MSGDATKLNKERDLILAQLIKSDPELKLSIGEDGIFKTYTRDQIMGHVKALDDVGQNYIKTQMKFMRGLKNGEIYNLLDELEGK